MKEIVQEVTNADTGTPVAPPGLENREQSKARGAPLATVAVRMVESPSSGWGELRDYRRL